MRLLLVIAVGLLLLGPKAALAEIITCPTNFSPVYKDCAVFLDPLLKPKPAQRCDRNDCRPAQPTIDASGRKVCIFTCFRRFEG